MKPKLLTMLISNALLSSDLKDEIEYRDIFLFVHLLFHLVHHYGSDFLLSKNSNLKLVLSSLVLGFKWFHN